MPCEHKNIMSKNCEIFCMDCGIKLPESFLTARAKPQEEQKPKKKKGGAKE